MRRGFGLLLMPAVRQASASEADAIRALLTAEHLPTADLATSRVHFLVAEQNGALTGAIGIEAFASVGLLRSLVVVPGMRGTGTGRALVEALEAHAQDMGLPQLVLLTETAAPFFARLGYAQAERSAMPDTIQATAEFRSLCPSSATCMTKRLPTP